MCVSVCESVCVCVFVCVCWCVFVLVLFVAFSEIVVACVHMIGHVTCCIMFMNQLVEDLLEFIHLCTCIVLR